MGYMPMGHSPVNAHAKLFMYPGRTAPAAAAGAAIRCQRKSSTAAQITETHPSWTDMEMSGCLTACEERAQLLQQPQLQQRLP